MRRIAATPLEQLDEEDLSAGSPELPSVGGVVEAGAEGGEELSADRSGGRSVADLPVDATECGAELSADRCGVSLAELRRRWQPSVDDEDWWFPSLGQQRADAFVALFLGLDVALTTEVVMHVRSDGVTFDDGTPTTHSAVTRLLDESFIRLLIHDADRRPINASAAHRHPTARQKRVVMEAHRHECVDCQSTDLLEFDHNPPWHQTQRTIVEELEPRCVGCHRARRRFETRPVPHRPTRRRQVA